MKFLKVVTLFTLSLNAVAADKKSKHAVSGNRVYENVVTKTLIKMQLLKTKEL
jgi:hypothetical protein